MNPTVASEEIACTSGSVIMSLCGYHIRMLMLQVTNRNSKVMPQIGHQDCSEDAGDSDRAPPVREQSQNLDVS